MLLSAETEVASAKQHMCFAARSDCCVSFCELFKGSRGRAGERPLYQNNSTASRRCDINNKVLTLPLRALLTADPPRPLQYKHTHAHSTTSKPWSSQPPLLPAAYLKEGTRKYEKWTPAIWKWYVVYEEGELLVWKINFTKLPTHSFY